MKQNQKTKTLSDTLCEIQGHEIAYLFSSLKLDITEYYIDNPKEAIKTYNRNQKEENK